jgi:hypothetical protein
MNAKNSTIPMVLALVMLLVPSTHAQLSSDRLDTVKHKMGRVRDVIRKLPEKHRMAFSASALNLVHLVENWDKLDQGLRKSSGRPRRAIPVAASSTTLPGASAVDVSNPDLEFVFSNVTGFTQSETSTAWCGNTVVVGFNDSGSLLESLIFGSGGLSFNGVARSTNQGRSFEDLGFLNPGANFFNQLAGDPVVACTDANTFYYSSLFFTGTLVPSPAFVSAISVSKSTNGGATFSDPVISVQKDLSEHFLDKEWMAVDPTNPNRIYVTYTDFDTSAAALAACGFTGSRIAIEMVRSIDGGTSWTAPQVIDEITCSPFAVQGLFVQGSQVAVGSGGEVYVAWEFYDADFVAREIRVRKSTNNGASFAGTVVPTSVVPAGDGFALAGNFRNFLDLQGLAIDRSGTATNGNLYIVWHDGRNLIEPDIGSLTGFYGFSDILLTRSVNGGAAWSAPVRVNQNADPVPAGGGTDQYQPGIAVDHTGMLGVCWYDRRHDPLNFAIDRFCATSNDAGASWRDHKESPSSWNPFHATDAFVNPFYMGDYDTVASDFTGAASGFIGAYQVMNTAGGLAGNSIPIPNPEVQAVRFR